LGDLAGQQAIIDTTVASSNDMESAIIARLPANGSGYTAIVRGANDRVRYHVTQMAVTRFRQSIPLMGNFRSGE
jgi:hypothetical protein